MTLTLLFPPSLGRITASARAEMLSEWLEKRLGQPVEITVAADYAELEDAIVHARIDLAWAPPAVCASVEDRAAVIFKAVRGGASMYRAVLLCKSRKIESIADLKGRRAAWVDRLSSGGFLLPAAYLRANGVDPDADLASQKFYGSYATAIRAVLSRDADFTSVYAPGEDKGAAMRILVDMIGERARHLRLLGFTPEAPADGLVVTSRPTADATTAAVERLCEDLKKSWNSNLLTVVLDAEALERAESGSYAALRQPPT